ncbi:hypothetical protein VH441_02050 [Psychrobacter sp. HD31]|uniref:hypothetical protein n=1 Tax=Psychrobacter sp. HD31 TaxID=3112003 RepID=UPI003DA5BAC5
MSIIKKYHEVNDKYPRFQGTDGIPYFGEIRDISDWDCIIASYRKLKSELFPQKVLFIMDDINQCEYTSMHASMQDELNVDESDFADGVDFDDQEQEKAFNINLKKARTEHIVNFLQRQDDFDVAQLTQLLNQIIEKTKRYDENDLKAMVLFNEKPLRVLNNIEATNFKEIGICIDDLPSDTLKIAMKPNGYFSSDLNTFENYYVINQLDKLGFEFIGLGAQLLTFLKKANGIVNYDELIEFLATIYPLDNKTKARFQKIIQTNEYLILPYCESPSVYLYFYE